MTTPMSAAGKYILMGVDGQLGRIAASAAVAMRAPGQSLVLTSYRLDAVPAADRAAWEAAGARVESLSYDDQPGMARCFAGAQAVSFVSTWLIGARRRAQHRNVVDAAVAAHVPRIAYTSFCGAGLRYDLPVLPQDHQATEQLIFASGLAFNLQRNYLYAQNIPQLFAPAWPYCGDRWLDNTGGVPGAYVSRDDCARCMAALLLGRGKPNTIYTITGPQAITSQDALDLCAEVSGYRAALEPIEDVDLYNYWESRGVPRTIDGDATRNDTPMKLITHDAVACGQVIRRGLMAEVTSAVEDLTGQKPVHPRQVFEQCRDILPKPRPDPAAL